MRLLLCLAERAGEVVGVDELLEQVWPGVIVTSDSVYQAITSLRRLLGDDPKRPTYIATVPRLGYRLIAAVDATTILRVPALAASGGASGLSRDAVPRTSPRPAARALLVGVALIIVAGAVSYLLVDHQAATQAGKSAPVVATMAPAPKSIAVLPFLDLTDAMNEEPFADGMTEELIGKLSKIHGLQVSAPTATFYFKDKQMAVADIAHSLGVTYILDGSVRKSDVALRVSARLVHADSGFVVWSETYDRPLNDKLTVQGDIADEVAAALARLTD